MKSEVEKIIKSTFSSLTDLQLILLGLSLIVLMGIGGNIFPIGRVANQAAAATVDPTNLVGKWLLDEGVGTTTADTSGKYGTGTLVGGPTWTTGSLGKAVHFDGVNDRIEIPNSTSLSPRKNMTAALWVKLDPRSTLDTASSNAKLLQKGSTYAKISYSIVNKSYVYGDVPQFRVQINNGHMYTVESTTTPIALGGWHHVAGVRNGTSLLLYIDGKLVSSRAISGMEITPNTEKLYLGESIKDADGALKGSLDDVRIYARALSVEEIKALVAEGSPVPPPVCGNSMCEVGETNLSCALDCGSGTTTIPKILPMGDSITRAGSNLSGSFRNYRKYLSEKLIAAGIPFDFIGSQQDVGVTWDPDHEGHAGWEAFELLAQLPTWLQTYTPDIVLLHIGTNDLLTTVPGQGSKTPDQVIDSVRSIIQLLRADNPRVKIVLAKIIPARTIPDALVEEYNAKIGMLATEVSASSSPVITADMYTNFDRANFYTDDLHPNEAGARFIADQWFAALKSLGL